MEIIQMLQVLVWFRFAAATTIPDLNGIDIVVAPYGFDRMGCGKLSPCRTVDYAVQHAKWNSVIAIDASFGHASNRTQKPLPSEKGHELYQPAIDIVKNITIVGIKGRPKLTKENMHVRIAFHIPYNVSKTTNIALRLVNLEFDMPVVEFTGGFIYVENCLLRSVPGFEITYLISIPHVILGGVLIYPSYVKVTLTNTTILGCNTFGAYDFSAIDFEMHNSTIDAISNHYQCLGILLSSFAANPERNSKIIIKGCIFKHVNCPVVIESKLDKSKVQITIINCTFYKNVGNALLDGGGAILLETTTNSTIEAYIDGCNFISNRANHGGAMYFRGVKAVVTNSNFKNNRAFFSGGAILALFTIDLVMKNNIFENNYVEASTEMGLSDQATRNIAYFDGLGGAIFFLAETTGRFVDCAFINNSAKFGGAVANVGQQMELVNCTFTRSSTLPHSDLGDFIHSTRRLHLDNVRLYATDSNPLATLIFHFAVPDTAIRPSLLSYSSFYVECPPGSNLASISSQMRRDCPLQSDFSGSTTKSYRCFLQYRRTCVPCSSKQYSLSKSYSYGSGCNDTLVQTDCFNCPYGGNCTEREIFSRPGFWGYVYGNKVQFAQCPKGYCCEKDQCDGITECAPNRIGRLCGQCQPGYTENLVGPECLPNIRCKPHLFWVALFVGAFLFSLILYYMDEIETLFTNLLWKYSILSLCSNLKQVRCSTEDELQEPLLLEDSQKTESLVTIVNDYKDLKGSCNPTTTFLPDNCQRENIKPSSNDNFIFAGLIKILFFFYQVQVFFVFRKSRERSLWDVMKQELISIFNLDVIKSHFGFVLCISPDLSATNKALSKPLFIVCTLLCTLLLFGCRSGISKCSFLSRRHGISYWRCKYLASFVQVLVLGYSSISTAVLTPLRCTFIGSARVMLIDGTVSCFSVTQYILMAVVATFVVPFVFAPPVLAKYLRSHEISKTEFFFGLLLPAPLLPYFIIRRNTKGRKSSKGRDRELIMDSLEPISTPSNVLEEEEVYLRSKICSVIEGPFRQEPGGRDYRYWESILIGSRLFVIISSILLFDLERNVVYILFSISLLAVHCYTMPFKSIYLNILQAFMLFNLCIIGILNFFPIYFFMSGFYPIGYVGAIDQKFQLVESLILLLLPMIGFGLFAIIVSWRILTLCISLLYLVIKVIVHTIRDRS